MSDALDNLMASFQQPARGQIRPSPPIPISRSLRHSCDLQGLAIPQADCLHTHLEIPPISEKPAKLLPSSAQRKARVTAASLGPQLSVTEQAYEREPQPAAPHAHPHHAAQVPTHHVGSCMEEHGYASNLNPKFRKCMEDEHTACRLHVPGLPSCQFFGCYDGHGGRDAVDFVRAHLHKMIERELRESATPQADVSYCVSRAFLKLDHMLLQLGTYNCGTTASVCLLWRGASGAAELHMANVGDSRCLLLSEKGPLRVTVDHLATDESEACRVQQEGGQIIGKRVGGSLALTRALGDHALKGAGGGVSATPHYVRRLLSAEDRFVVLASDGVWDVMTDDLVYWEVMSHASEMAQQLSMRLVMAAIERGTRDNVSALIVRL
eukprot:CAMPEP_0181258020 /NCGR_PEP_ID=MMETSP1096-20121128/50558_1 /TAXON_ID=156174 ORGANISM="Chrysochromulina ericina, Strain CCMP281" /NCGR_SAMPLE_ID=MMETSP1096 /ASSEMBLY_ACC=CAM_ASM_000453 /LENGTH=379 /DNA_ID=CAMNT_0023356383 /DNA_START=12 /DNA_END=1151 /DNA_ORIENTATION=-